MSALPFGPTAVAVLLEVIGQDRPTVPSIARALRRSRSTVHMHLVRLRAHQLVEWTPGTMLTIRSTVAVVPVGAL